MAIIKHPLRTPGYSPWREFDAPFDRLSRLFDTTPFADEIGGMWTPAVNISETKDELLLTAELPGLTEDNVHIELEDRVLTISGEKTETRSEEDKERQQHVWERSYGSFRRSFRLPGTVDADGVAATFENGVLSVRLPKAVEAKGRKIEISKN